MLKSSDGSNLDKIKLVLAVLLAMSLPFSESLKTISILLLLLILLIQLYKKEINIEMSAIHYGFIFLVLSALVSSIFAENTAKSIKGAKDILFYTIPFFVGCSITDEKQTRKIIWSLYLSIIVAVLIGIYQSIQTHKNIEIHSLGNQNYIAMYLIIIIISMISIILFSDKETRFQKGLLGIFISLSIIAAILTAMRSSFLGLFIFICILIFAQKKPKFYFPIFIAGIAVIGLFAAYLYKPMWTKLMDVRSFVSRMYVWEYAFDLFKENPITGIGLNHFKYTFPLSYIHEPGATYFDAHSVYFQTASQIGILGVLALFLIIFGFLKNWFRLQNISGFKKGLKYSAMGGFLVTFVGGIFDTTLHHESAILFTLLTGIMSGIGSRDSNPGDE